MKETHLHKRIIMLEPYEYEPALTHFSQRLKSKNISVKLENTRDYAAFNVTETSPSMVLVISYELAKYDRKRVTKFSEKVDNAWDLFLHTLAPNLKSYYNFTAINYPENKQEVLDLLPKSTI